MLCIYMYMYMHMYMTKLMLGCFFLCVFQGTTVFDMWFRVDARPFKQALLTIIKRWSFMFKQHLIDHVTTRYSYECMGFSIRLVVVTTCVSDTRTGMQSTHMKSHGILEHAHM